jgi:FtsP/CotA-like multicopper oxidase with cupredoxin domain
MPLSRRQFLYGSAAAGAGLFLSTFIDGRRVVRAISIPGGTLPPEGILKYQAPLLIPPVMPRAGTRWMRGGKFGDVYEISVRQFAQQILPAGMPATTVWGYGAVKSGVPGGLLLHNAPSLTIEAQVGRPVEVKWINELVDASGNYLPHLLPVDPTLPGIRKVC